MRMLHFRKAYWITCSAIFVWLGQARADEPLRTGLFANAKEIFRPLMADPKELQLSLRSVTQVSHKMNGEVAMGDYFGLYRWTLPGMDSYLQWNIGGGAFARFDMVSDRKDLEVVDFYANMPVDLKFGRWSTRIMPYHVSSHLGDDFIVDTGAVPEKYSADQVRLLESCDITSQLRLYVGYNYIIRTLHLDYGRHAFQTGFEWTSRWLEGGHLQPYWANDFQSWQRIGWNPIFNSQLGVRLAHSPQDIQKLALFLEFSSGHQSYGQFFTRQETVWIFGLRFELP